MDELKLFALLQGIEEKLEENNELLKLVNEKLDNIGANLISTNKNMSYNQKIKNVLDDILRVLKHMN